MTTAEILKMNGIKPSVIRIKVYEYLRGTKSHPTADEIYNELNPKIPTLSKTSVYNTVKLLVGAGLSKNLTIDGSQTRYDADTSVHGHFWCKKCRRVFDFDVSETLGGELDGFVVEFKEIYFGGLCRSCAAYEDKN